MREIETWRVYLSISFDIDTFQLRETSQVLAYQEAKLLSILFTLLLVAYWSLMLHADPQFIHFGEVLQNKVHRIFYCTSLSVIFLLY